MVIVISGFPQKISALQFEWNWQNPHLSKRLSNTTPTEKIMLSQTPKSWKQRRIEREWRFRKGTLSQKLQDLLKIMQTVPFSRLPLTINFIDTFLPQTPILQSQFSKFISIFQNTHIKCLITPLSEFNPKIFRPQQTKCLPLPKESNSFSSSLMDVKKDSSSSCSLCRSDLTEYEGEKAVMVACPSDNCAMRTHIICLSLHFLESKGNDKLIPVEGGNCPNCSIKLEWSQVLNLRF